MLSDQLDYVSVDPHRAWATLSCSSLGGSSLISASSIGRSGSSSPMSRDPLQSGTQLSGPDGRRACAGSSLSTLTVG